ncbi:MAG: hypothetical protein BGO25_10840 [Acidobacteriales bacterium 59-55]|nr:hypothetical protein [Terriglobales bacterium]ODU55297.1 MAG: hypothetical protein ABT04_01130 [Granulicella sp. SCN 62-9]OJV43672.1 MAG: hypothetical protein BGO25_10840 [Acidobacteriales bacterium 59-55]
MAKPDLNAPDPVTSPAHFKDSLIDAERLLKYAAETGVEVDVSVRAAVLQARSLPYSQWTEVIIENLLDALTKLAALLKPVTAASLTAWSNDTSATVLYYLRVAIILACVIVPASIASFATSALSNSLRADIASANDLAVKLRAQLGAVPPPIPAGATVAPALPPGVNEAEIIAELQEYASTIRLIDSRARELNWMVLPRVTPPQIGHNGTRGRAVFELDPVLANFYEARDSATATFQSVRYFAQSLLNNVSIFYGAINTCILPVLYALLGTCAYLLRNFESQMSNHTFIPSPANSARFLIAAIGGAVVGLFNNFTITPEASVPPLALAFLVGYAVDVFFAFLEGLLKAFTKAETVPPPAVHP